MKDKDGFHILQRNSIGKTNKNLAAQVKDHKEKDHKIKVKKPKVNFKKGGWKWGLWRKLQDWHISKYTKHFTSTNHQIAVIYHPDGDSDYVIKGRGFIHPSNVKMLETVDKDCMVLVSVGNGVYMNISLKSYKKLTKLQKVAIHFKLTAYNDYEPDQPMDIVEYDDVFDNINALMGFINYHHQGILGVYDIQAMCIGMTDFVYDFKIMTYSADGKVKTYKGDMNDFMIDYGLRPF